MCARFSFLAMALVWCLYEYLKTLGFLGFPYGILAYTQWKNTLLIQSASWGGIWPLSLLLALSSATVSCLLQREKSVKEIKLLLISFGTFFTFLLLSGAFLLKKYNSEEKKSFPIICVQNNTDSNKYGLEVYKRDSKTLMDLTDQALDDFNAKIVVWPETAFVPPLLYNYIERNDTDRYAMVLNLLDFMQKRDCAFVIGNQIKEKEGGSYKDYNGVLVFDRLLENIEMPAPLVYKKIHLVPFAETFPYKKLFPGIYKALLMGDSNLWDAGSEFSVFNIRGLSFSCPVCFEDTFGDLCRRFVLEGSDAFINLSNDSWSQSNACQMQHLSMAVFRSVENRVPSARSTGSGVTCLIDILGRIKNHSDPFAENYVCGNIETLAEKKLSFYTLHGDYFVIIELFLLIFMSLLEALKHFTFFRSLLCILTRGKNITKIEECLT